MIKVTEIYGTTQSHIRSLDQRITAKSLRITSQKTAYNPIFPIKDINKRNQY